VAQLSEWLQIMLAEIARKRHEAQLAAGEHERRLAAAPRLAAGPRLASAPRATLAAGAMPPAPLPAAMGAPELQPERIPIL